MQVFRRLWVPSLLRLTFCRAPGLLRFALVDLVESVNERGRESGSLLAAPAMRGVHVAFGRAAGVEGGLSYREMVGIAGGQGRGGPGRQRQRLAPVGASTPSA